MNPYEVLQVTKQATLKEVKAAYRRLSKDHHPDKVGGESERFREIKLAFDVLSNPDRRARYDSTGRTDESPATPKRVQTFIDQMMRNVIESQRPDGSSDDPCWDNIRDKIILSIAASRAPLKNTKFLLQRQLERTVRMLERFKPKAEFDPVGDALRLQKSRIESEIRTNDDAMELSIEAERVMKTYEYNVGPGPEGHFSPGPTGRRLLSGSRITFPHP